MPHTLSFGLDVGVYGKLATRAHILEMAMLGETSGFDSLWVADHVIFPVTVTSRYPYNASGDMSHEPLLEPIATMGVLVGATQRVRIGVAVLSAWQCW